MTSIESKRKPSPERMSNLRYFLRRTVAPLRNHTRYPPKLSVHSSEQWFARKAFPRNILRLVENSESF